MMAKVNVFRVGKELGLWIFLVFFGSTALVLIFYHVGHGFQLEILLDLVVTIVTYGILYHRVKGELQALKATQEDEI
ncbi:MULTISPECIES: hypothetical protein [Acidithrix]|nr:MULTISPECIES: hypothetical protein [Acidithrix]